MLLNLELPPRDLAVLVLIGVVEPLLGLLPTQERERPEDPLVELVLADLGVAVAVHPLENDGQALLGHLGREVVELLGLPSGAQDGFVVEFTGEKNKAGLKQKYR